MWSYAYVVQGDTEKEAKDYFDEYVNQKGDWEAVQNLVDTMIANAKTLPPRGARRDEEALHRRLGRLSADRHAGADRRWPYPMSKMGLDGTLLNWPRYVDDQLWFKDHVYPLVQQAGLR